MACSDPSHRFLYLAPVACEQCRGWLDHDGTVMSTEEMLARYPHMRGTVAAIGRLGLPDGSPTAADRVGEFNRLLGALARTLLAVIFLGGIFVVLVTLLLH